MIQNAAARLVFNEPKRAHVTPLFISHHWLQVVARIKFKTCLCIEQPQAQHPPTFTHYYKSTSLPDAWDLLVSDASWYHHREAQNHFPEHFGSPFLAGGMNFLPLSGMLIPWQFSSDSWKLIFFITIWQHRHICTLWFLIREFAREQNSVSERSTEQNSVLEMTHLNASDWPLHSYAQQNQVWLIIWCSAIKTRLSQHQPKAERRFKFDSWCCAAHNVLITPVWSYQI